MPEVVKYNSLDELFEQLANQVIDNLNTALEKGETSLVVSGGSTPGPLFKTLAATQLDWHKVTFVPSDERWLATDNDASNEKLIRSSLIQNQAANAKIQGLKLDFDTALEAEAALQEKLTPILGSYAAAIVGMGPDGHFASIFPGTPQEAKALSTEGSALCYAIDATGCPVAGANTERMTLTLPALLNANHIYLLITGTEKLKIINKALEGDQAVAKLPIYQLLQQTNTPVTVCWA